MHRHIKWHCLIYNQNNCTQNTIKSIICGLCSGICFRFLCMLDRYQIFSNIHFDISHIDIYNTIHTHIQSLQTHIYIYFFFFFVKQRANGKQNQMVNKIKCTQTTKNSRIFKLWDRNYLFSFRLLDLFIYIGNLSKEINNINMDNTKLQKLKSSAK